MQDVFIKREGTQGSQKVHTTVAGVSAQNTRPRPCWTCTQYALCQCSTRTKKAVKGGVRAGAGKPDVLPYAHSKSTPVQVSRLPDRVHISSDTIAT